MSRPGQILFVGALTLDRIHRMVSLPSGGGKYIPLETVLVSAGMASSAALSAARLGAKPHLLARVGDDNEGTRLVRDMTNAGVNCSLVRTVENTASATATIIVDATGERIVIPDYPEGLTLAEPEPINLSEFAGVLVDPRWPRGAANSLSAARRSNLPAVLDCDVAPADILRGLVPLATHIVASRPGATAVTGENDAEAAASKLLEITDGEVVITDGANGALIADRRGGRSTLVPSFKVHVADTTAAGDVFHGAFVVALCAGSSILNATRFASAAAAIKCTRFGGVSGAPTLTEVEAFIASHSP